GPTARPRPSSAARSRRSSPPGATRPTRSPTPSCATGSPSPMPPPGSCSTATRAPWDRSRLSTRCSPTRAPAWTPSWSSWSTPTRSSSGCWTARRSRVAPTTRRRSSAPAWRSMPRRPLRWHWSTGVADCCARSTGWVRCRRSRHASSGRWTPAPTASTARPSDAARLSTHTMSFLRRPKIESKTTEQILLMREAGLIVGRTLELARQRTVPGITTGQLDALAEEHIRTLGAGPSFKGYHGFPGSLCVSVNEEVVHGIPGERVLREGDLVSIDCGAIYQGWHGDAAISLIVGGPEAGRPQDVALVEDTEAAMWAGIAALRAGERLFDVGDAVEDSIDGAAERRRAAGTDIVYGILEDYVGHGIGTSMHMDPHVPNYSVSSKGPTVPSGATLAIEPMVTLGTIETTTLEDDWTVITSDRSRAAHWENTVAVSDAGLWVLTALDGGAAHLGAAYHPLAEQ